MKISLSLTFIVGIFLGTQVLAQESVPGEFIVKLKSSHSSSATNKFLGKASRGQKLNLRKSFRNLKMYHFKVSKGQNSNQVLEDLKNDPNVEYVEPNYILGKSSLGEVSNLKTAEQIKIMSDSAKVLPTNSDIGLEEIYAKSSSLAAGETVVAVIDTGLDLTHPLFTGSNAIWVNSAEVPGNGIDDDGNGYIDDVNGWNFVSNSGAMIDDDDHGTHVSGIVLSASIDIFAASLAQSTIKIMPLKFLDGGGLGTTSDAISAINYAIDNGAKVLNNSWGGPSYSLALHEAVSKTYEAGLVFIAAAGNAGENNDVMPMYPANFDVPNVVSVGATLEGSGSTIYLAGFSNFGYNKVSLGSPGVSIVSSVPGGAFGYMSGTSMASPFVSGFSAMMINESPAMLGYQVKSILEDTTSYSSNLVGKMKTEGDVAGATAINLAKVTSVEGNQPAYSISGGRELASGLANTGGCGLVSSVYKKMGNNNTPKGGGGPSPLMAFFVIIIMSLPLAAVKYLKSDQKENRAHERFDIESSVVMNVGGKELVGSVSSISLGGVQVNTDAMLEQGGIVKMSISSPDGKDLVEVQGKVVWSETKESYGLQFDNSANSSVLNKISNWTQALGKAS